MLLLGNIKGFGTAPLRQPASLSLPLSPDCGGRGGGGGVRGSGSILIDALSQCKLAGLSFGLATPELQATFFNLLIRATKERVRGLQLKSVTQAFGFWVKK